MKGKHVLVCGMARSGIAAARLLYEKGALVRINDTKTREQLGSDIEQLAGLDIEWYLGKKIDEALEGIEILVLSPGIPAALPALEKARQQGIEVIGEIELSCRMAEGLLIGITGTNGKTTTTTLTGEIFKAMGKQTFVVGNIGEPYSAHVLETSPDTVTVCELSSYQLETVTSIKPRVSMILNLTEDHLLRHKTMENYGRTKERVFANETGDDAVVLNLDDPITAEMANRVKCRVLFFSRKTEPENGAFVRDGLVIYRLDGREVPVIEASKIRIPGPHNLENALAAVAATMYCGVPVEIIRDTLISFAGVEHRIETVRTVDGVTYINDSKGTNPDSTIKAVDAMRKPTVILLGGSEKNSDYTQMSRVIKDSNVYYAVLLGATGEAIGRSLSQNGFDAFEYVGYDFEKAILTAKAHSVEGGNVLLSPACASFDMFKDFEHRGEEFKRIVVSL